VGELLFKIHYFQLGAFINVFLNGELFNKAGVRYRRKCSQTYFIGTHGKGGIAYHGGIIPKNK